MTLARTEQMALSPEMEPPRDDAAALLAGLVSGVQAHGVTPESAAALEKLTELYERIQDRNARTAFNEAMARCQAECPKIPRSKNSKQVGERSGAKFGFPYFALEDIAAVLDPVARKHGLSYTFDRQLTETGNDLIVTCIVRHVAGHSERTSFPVPVDKVLATGNAAQQREAVDTYGQRRALSGAFGLTWVDPDPEQKDEGPRLSPDQAAELELAIKEGKVDGGKLYGWLGIVSLYELPASRFEEVKGVIARAAAKKAKAQQ